MKEKGGLKILTSCDDGQQEIDVNRYVPLLATGVVQSLDLLGDYGYHGRSCHKVIVVVPTEVRFPTFYLETNCSYLHVSNA
jgi:hypothetical protein